MANSRGIGINPGGIPTPKYGVDYGPNITGGEPDYEEMLRKRLAKKAYDDYMSGENFTDRQRMESDPDFAMGKMRAGEIARRNELAAKGDAFIKQSVLGSTPSPSMRDTNDLMKKSGDDVAFADYAKKLRRDGKNQEFSKLMIDKYGLANASIQSGKY